MSNLSKEIPPENAEKLLNNITSKIISAAIEVHRTLGPGLLESAYEACLAFELMERGIYRLVNNL